MTCASVLLLGACLSLQDWANSAENAGPGSSSRASSSAADRKKIVLIAGKKSHGPVGNGIHDYGWSVRLSKVMLDNSNVKDQVRVEYHLDGWPAEARAVEDADTIVVISDGRDGDQYEESLHLADDERVANVDRLMKRGCGLVTFHFSTFAPQKYAEKVLDWNGGYFQWETDGQRQWYSAITTAEAEVRVATPDHPVARGLESFKMREEFYYNLRFRSEESKAATSRRTPKESVRPIWEVPALPGRDRDGRVVAWVRQREDGGRGFGTTCGHFYENWKHDQFRKAILNGIVWTAKLDVPAGGVEARFYTHEEIEKQLAAERHQSIRVLLFAGNEAHKWHNWEKTTPAIRAALERDDRVKVEISHDIEDLAQKKLGDYQVILLNYCNWHDPRGLSDASKAAFVQFLKHGGGLVVVHFANGAFHFSLPMAEGSDWPEYRKIVRRVWDHHGKEGPKSGHDAFGQFAVRVANGKHAITDGLKDFDVTDELYFNQAGTEPVEPLITARSKVTGKDEPLAFAYEYGQARVFQTLLGHSEQTYETPEARELLRRAVAWAARRDVRPVDAHQPEASARADSGHATDPKPPLSDDSSLGKSTRESPYNAEFVTQLIAEARTSGDARRGAEVFRAPQFACLSCHKVGGQGATVGPELTAVANCLSPDLIVESVLWPKRQVKEEYVAHAVVTADGKIYQGYKTSEDDRELVLRDAATADPIHIAKSDIEERRVAGTLMPDGLAESMSRDQLRDLVRFLFELNREGGGAAEMITHAHRPATFPYVRAPLRPEHWTSWQHPVNRDRLYDFYAKEAEYFMKQPSVPALLPEFPGLDGGQLGHWGNQNEAAWADGRWNETHLGSLQCGVFRGAGVTVPRGVCVRLGDRAEVSACFNPDTLCYEAVWQGGFVTFSSVRHGFLDGLIMDGTALPRPDGRKPDRPFVYHGFYRSGRRVVFSYRIGDQEFLDAPWVEGGKFTRMVAPANEHPLAHLIRGGQAQWPQIVETRGTLGAGGPYVVDTITPPFDNPWKSLMFFGDHDFFPDGTAMLCTMQGDVWRVDGLDDKLDHVRWRRVAAGLHHAQGLVIADGQIFVLGRDQVTRLHDLNGDSEADFYECFSNAFTTSPAGHDFICGLERDAAGNFYTVSGNQGLLRISADGKRADVLATGFRNPDGLGLLPDGSLTVPCSEGEWTPASMICLVKSARSQADRVRSRAGSSHQPDASVRTNDAASSTSATTSALANVSGYFGYGGPRNGRPPDLPLVYLPRGLDNSSGAQVYVSSDRWGPLQGQLVHLSFGAGSHFLVLRDEVDGQPQGAVVPLAGEFLSGAHRGAFNPRDGQLYVTGMAGWGSYTPLDGSFQRVRYTGKPAQLPIAFHAYQNGVRVTFSQPLDRAIAAQPNGHFAQGWNYRYSAAYGSPEFSPRHVGMPGHDPLAIRSAHVQPDGRSIFLEIPELQPLNQLHIHMRVDSGPAHDLFATIHKLGEPFAEFPGYRPVTKQIAVHPILTDMAMSARAVPNPWRKTIRGARVITIEAGKNLTFSTKSFRVRTGESIQLVFKNPDVVPHNWVLAKPGSLERVGHLANKLVSDPEAAVRHYVPRSDDVLLYSDVVAPQSSFAISFHAPKEKGRYPYLCTFPGHWMVMNGQMIVE
jgi:putative heme-binding domain-containing protein